jgi:hypothetical protein
METEKKRGQGQAEFEAFDEGGHSEMQADLDAEIQAGEWQSLKRFKIYQQRSRQWKIIATYQAVSNRLNQMVALYYKLVRDNPAKGAAMLSELQKLRMLQEILLNILAWEENGQPVDRDMIPQELLDVIE